MNTSRRGFLKLLGIGAAGIVAPVLVAPEPERRIWQVGRNAPVPYRGPSNIRFGAIESVTINGRAFRVHSNAEADELFGEGSSVAARLGDFLEPPDDQVDAIAYARLDAEPWVQRSIVGDSHFSSASAGYATEDVLKYARLASPDEWQRYYRNVEVRRGEDFIVEHVVRDPEPGAPNALRDIGAAMRSFWSETREEAGMKICQQTGKRSYTSERQAKVKCRHMRERLR